MAYNVYIPMYIDRTEERRSRDIVTHQDWNEMMNLNITQGDHNSEYLYELKNYLFGEDGLTGEIGTIDAHIADKTNPHEVTNTQVGLSLVENIAKEDLPISVATQSALDLKEAKSTASLLCAKIGYNKDTGIIVFKDRNDTIMKTIDLNIEKIPVSMKLEKRNNKWYLVITNTDGTETSTDVSNLFNPINFESSDASYNIQFNVATAADGTKTIKAVVKNGSITLAMLNEEVTAQLIAYVNAASTSASAAADSASAAATSESNAANSASSASTSKTAAANSATAAANSATAASNSATASANSASASATSAGESADSATAAATSEGNAAASATDASESESAADSHRASALASKNAAALSETNAFNSATAAANSAAAAATSASNAASSASSASTSATNATNSATAAATSESNASDSEGAAAMSAAAALASQIAAATSASDANASQLAASTSETNAANSASASAGSASTASTKATNAANSATAAATSAGEALASKNAAANSATAANASKMAAASSATAASGSATAAAGSADDASESAALSESWAVGGTGTRTGEDTDNAKYWSLQAEHAASGGVYSFNSRAGHVVPAANDYNTDQIAEGTTNRFVTDTEKSIWNGKSEPPTAVTAILSTTWTGSGPYTQDLTVSGVTDTNNILVALGSTATPEQREVARAAMLIATAQSEDTITVTADGDKPTVTLPIQVLVLEGSEGLAALLATI